MLTCYFIKNGSKVKGFHNDIMLIGPSLFHKILYYIDVFHYWNKNNSKNVDITLAEYVTKDLQINTFVSQIIHKPSFSLIL